MNWKIILSLTFVGILIFIGSTFGVIPAGKEWIGWIILGIISGIVISRTCSRVFMHGVVTGLITGIIGSVIQSVFFDSYLLHNPSSLDGFKQLPVSLAPQYVILFSGPFFGIAYGIVVGLIAIIVSGISRKK